MTLTDRTIANGFLLSDLILVPTPREMEVIRPLLSGDDDRLSFQLCGFGPIAAAARAGALIARYHPERVLHPLKRVGEKGEGKFERVGWDEALDAVAQKTLFF